MPPRSPTAEGEAMLRGRGAPPLTRAGRSEEPAGDGGWSFPHHGHVGETADEDLPHESGKGEEMSPCGLSGYPSVCILLIDVLSDF